MRRSRSIRGSVATRDLPEIASASLEMYNEVSDRGGGLVVAHQGKELPRSYELQGFCIQIGTLRGLYRYRLNRSVVPDISMHDDINSTGARSPRWRHRHGDSDGASFVLAAKHSLPLSRHR